MQLTPLTFKSVRARAVVLKLRRPVVARIDALTLLRAIRQFSSIHRYLQSQSPGACIDSGDLTSSHMISPTRLVSRSRVAPVVRRQSSDAIN